MKPLPPSTPVQKPRAPSRNHNLKATTVVGNGRDDIRGSRRPRPSVPAHSAASPRRPAPSAAPTVEDVQRSFHSVRLPPGAQVSPALANKPKAQQRTTRVAIMGTPNAGKSMLMNVLVRHKVSAVSPKSHTTRINTVGVTTEGDTQLVFVDTPCIMPREVRGALGRMMADAWRGALSADVAILLVDSARRLGDAERALARDFATHFGGATKKLLILNKIDLLRDRSDLLPLIEQLTAITEFDAVFLISALQYDGVEDVKDFLFAMSAKRPWEFAADTASPAAPPDRVAEIIREKLYQRLNQEVPYAITQLLGEWRELPAAEYAELQLRFAPDAATTAAADTASGDGDHVTPDGDDAALWDHLGAEDRAPDAPHVAELHALLRQTSNHNLPPLPLPPSVPGPTPAPTPNQVQAARLAQQMVDEAEDSDAAPSNAGQSAAAPAVAALRIVVFLYVPKASQAKMVVGAGGGTLRQVTEAAQRDVARLLRRPVVLSLRVKLGTAPDAPQPQSQAPPGSPKL